LKIGQFLHGEIGQKLVFWVLGIRKSFDHGKVMQTTLLKAITKLEKFCYRINSGRMLRACPALLVVLKNIIFVPDCDQ
jgi:hypothetical protein